MLKISHIRNILTCLGEGLIHNLSHLHHSLSSGHVCDHHPATKQALSTYWTIWQQTTFTYMPYYRKCMLPTKHISVAMGGTTFIRWPAHSLSWCRFSWFSSILYSIWSDNHFKKEGLLAFKFLCTRIIFLSHLTLHKLHN